MSESTHAVSASASDAGLENATSSGAGLENATSSDAGLENATSEQDAARPSELAPLDEALQRARQAAADMASAGDLESASDEHIAALTGAHDELRAVLDRVDGGR